MSFTFSSLFEPKNCATIIPIPTDKPATKEKNKKLSEFVVPIAPNALGPTKFPTIMESTMLYNCWNMFPINKGTANCKSNFQGVPFVMSFKNLFSFDIIFLIL